MKRVLVVFVMLAACSVLLAESIKWEMTNIYPKTSSELQAWTNEVPNVGTVDLLAEMIETKRRVDILWTAYTNRMEQVARLKERRKAAEEKRKAAEYRNEVRRKYRRK